MCEMDAARLSGLVSVPKVNKILKLAGLRSRHSAFLPKGAEGGRRSPGMLRDGNLTEQMWVAASECGELALGRCRVGAKTRFPYNRKRRKPTCDAFIWMPMPPHLCFRRWSRRCIRTGRS